MAAFNRAHLSTILFVILVVSSIGLVAATIDSVVMVETAQGGQDSGSDRASSSTSDRLNVSVSGEGTGEGGGQQIDLVYCIEFLQNPLAILGVIAGMVTLIYVVYRRYNAATAGLSSAGILPIVMLVYFLLTNCHGSGGGGASLFSGSDVLSGSGGMEAPGVPPIVIGLFFAGTVVLAIVMVFNTTGEEETFEPIEEEPPEPETADFARAAGRAADRIEEANVSVDNAVYRAWLQMTTLLNIENPETTAPRDFAKAAIEVGLDSDDVNELTELFTEVRYGGKSPESREDRAIQVLRNIEQTYQDSVKQSGDNE